MSEGEKSNKLVDVEINKLKSAVNDGQVQTGKGNSIEWSDFKTKTVQKSMIMGIVLVALNQFSGVASMVSYTAIIFRASDSNMSPNMSAIVVGSILTLSNIVVPNVIDRLGRKVNIFCRNVFIDYISNIIKGISL